MQEKFGQASAIITDKLILLALHGEDQISPTIDKTDIRSILADFEWKLPYLGFRLARQFNVTVKIPGETDIVTSTLERAPQSYNIADRVLARNELLNRPGDSQWAQNVLLEDPDAVFFENSTLPFHLNREQRKDTVLIDRKGRQIWPVQTL